MCASNPGCEFTLASLFPLLLQCLPLDKFLNKAKSTGRRFLVTRGLKTNEVSMIGTYEDYSNDKFPLMACLMI